MKICVVIVTYNASPWLFKCLSGLTASGMPLSVIVVDNNSSDDTLSIIDDHFKDVILIKSARNLGFGRANNMGMHQALKENADYVFLLNQDAWIKPGAIQRLIQISERHPEFYILSPLHLDVTESRLDLNFSRYAGPDYCKLLFSDLVVSNDHLQDIYETKFVNAALWLLPKPCLLKLGGFDPVFPHYGEDDDFVHRVHYHGYKVGICPSAAGVHARSQEPFSMNKLPVPKRYQRMKVDLLIPLKNINEKFFRQVGKAYIILIKGILRTSLQLQAANFFIYLRLLLHITPALFKIATHRKISKEPGKPVIWFTSSVRS